MKDYKKILKITGAAVLGVIIAIVFLYRIILPLFIQSDLFIDLTKNVVYKITKANLTLENPKIKTSVRPRLDISFDKLLLEKENNTILNIEDFKTDFSYRILTGKSLKFRKLTVDKIFIDVDKLISLIPSKTKTEANEKEIPDFKIDIFDALFYINDVKILSSLPNNAKLTFEGRKILLEDKKNPKHLRFLINALIQNGDEELKITFSDNNRFYTKNKKLIINDCPLKINDSDIHIKSLMSKDKFGILVESDNFHLKDGAEILSTNLIIPNGKEIMAEILNPGGISEFEIKMNKEGLSGDINIKNASFNLKSLAKMPVYADKGKITITPDIIKMYDFKGYYGDNRENKLSLTGTVEDYYKSVDTKIIIQTIMTDNFTKDYLSKLAGINITMTGDTPAGTRIEIFSKNNDIDINYMAKLSKGNDILLEGASLSPINYDRAILCNMHVKSNILNIENIKYYIAKDINKDSKIKPILTLNGNVDLADNSKILNFGFEIPKPLPSEFLNVFLGQRLFRKGMISGNLEFLNGREIPKLKGRLAMDKVIIPSQRLFIKKGEFKTDRERLLFSVEGIFRRSRYDFKGNIANNITFPITINGVKLTLDNVDLERILMLSTSAATNTTANTAAANTTNQKENKKANQAPNTLTDAKTETKENKTDTKAEEDFMKAMENNEEMADDDNQALVFVPNLVIIKRGSFNLIKGKYKEVEFGNIKAVFSLDKDGKLKIDSNRFDLADGITSGKIRCDLLNNKFRFILGVKDVDSDKIATALLNLKREITGLASGIIDISTDNTMKLNGVMKFAINDGTIEKIGLVEYALNFVSFFRNPMAMISPSTLFDFVNIPEGRFDKISGELDIKDNVINKMMIKSSADQLATLIMGRFDLVTRDASLRIYTKFTNKNKGAAGFLRNISLNSLANREHFGSSNDINYYAAELEMIPPLNYDEKDCQIFLTTVEGDVEHNNFLSALKKIK